MTFQFRKPHLAVYRNAVVDNMQIRGLKIDDAFAAGIHHVGVPDIPFLRDSPIKHLRASRHLTKC